MATCLSILSILFAIIRQILNEQKVRNKEIKKLHFPSKKLQKNPKNNNNNNNSSKKLEDCKVGLGLVLTSPSEEPNSRPISNNILSRLQVIKVHELLLGSSISPNPCIFCPDFLFTRKNGFLERPLTSCSKHRNAGFLRLEEIKNSDNYTRITNYFPYPKVTHMYNDCILEFSRRRRLSFNHNFNRPDNYPPKVHNLRRWSIFNTNKYFLKKCKTCDKSLKDIDIYIYRGEESYCSLNCRFWKVMAEKEYERIVRMLPILPSSFRPVHDRWDD